MSEADSIGMMDLAFFVGRGELLSWVNDFFQLQLTKVEQCATGAVYCQIVDAVCPGTVTMGKVKWGAKHDYEYVENYKVLQQAFAKNEIKRYIDVDKLVKAKYQDNLEFLQWLKAFFDLKYNGQPYDSLGRRKSQDLFYILGGNKVAIGGASAGPTAVNKAPTKEHKVQSLTKAPAVNASKVMHDSSNVSHASKVSHGAKSVVSSGTKTKQPLSSDIGKLQSEIQDMRMNMDTVEKERDFYFGKLRDIEILLQSNEIKKTPLTESVLQILYASEEEKVHIDESGHLTITKGALTVPAAAVAEDDNMLNEDPLGAEDDEMVDTAEEIKDNN